jgi:hypothetical protein
MKKLVGIILAVGLTLFVIAEAINDFIDSEGIRYFVEQPYRLLFVTAIGVAGGLVVFGFFALSPRLQRQVKLVALGCGGIFVVLAGAYYAYQFASLPAQLDPSLPWQTPWPILLPTIGIGGSLWLQFYKVLRSRGPVDSFNNPAT